MPFLQHPGIRFGPVVTTLIRTRAQFEVGPIQNIVGLQLGPSCDIGFGIGPSNIESSGPFERLLTQVS